MQASEVRRTLLLREATFVPINSCDRPIEIMGESAGAVHTIRVELPHHLRTLAGVNGHEVPVHVQEATMRAVLDALEAEYPMLCGTIRDHVTQERRAFLRFFACMQDISFDPVDTPLPAAIVAGREPLIILGAVAGGTASGCWIESASSSSNAS
jgi:hypothetical protein